MKRILKAVVRVVKIVASVTGVLAGITLSGWFIWQVMPQNPHVNEWRWDVPPFPFSIAVWFVGIPIFIAFGFIPFAVLTGIGSEISARKDAKKAPPTNEQEPSSPQAVSSTPSE